MLGVFLFSFLTSVYLLCPFLSIGLIILSQQVRILFMKIVLSFQPILYFMRILLIQEIVIQWWKTFKINVIKNAAKGEGRGRDQEGPQEAVKVLIIIYLLSWMFVLLLFLNNMYTLHILFRMHDIFHNKLFTIPSSKNAKNWNKGSPPSPRKVWHQKQKARVTNSNLLLTVMLLPCVGLPGAGGRSISIFVPGLPHLPRTLNKYHHSWKALPQGAVTVVLNKFKV